MNIIKALLTPNSYSRCQQKLQEVTTIVVHWVGNPNTSAKANRNYFESLKDKKIFASSHYIIGLEGEILQCIPENEIAYHATSANSYSIGIENCHPDWEGKFNSKTYGSLVELCADICKRYGLNPTKDIIRHYDVSKKVCPKYYVNHPEAWESFKKDVKIKLDSMNEDAQLMKALKVLSGHGIELNDKIWSNVMTMDMKYAKLMVEKLGKGFGKKTYEETIAFFISKGCINTASVWKNEIFKPEYCRALLIKVSNLLED